MRLRVVYDASGRIVAAAGVPEGDDDSVAVAPVAASGQSEAELEVPGDMTSEELDVVCTRLRVDGANNQLVPVTEDA